MPFAFFRPRWMIGLLAVVIAAGVWAWAEGFRPVPSEESSPAEPVAAAPTYKAAPNFERSTLSSGTVRLADWRGRVVVLNFWATWCPPCRAEIPGLIALQRAYGAEQVRFIGVALDEEGESVVRPYAEEMGINYPLVTHEALALAEQYGGHYVLPTTFVIDRQGRIRQRFMRAVAEDELRAVLDPLLDGS